MNELLDVVKVKALSDYKLELEFENGERRLFDMAPIIDKKPFQRLKVSNTFFAARVDYVSHPGRLYRLAAPRIVHGTRRVARAGA